MEKLENTYEREKGEFIRPDDDFDRLLRESLPPGVGRDITRLVTPWKWGLYFILASLFLTWINIELYLLNLILPLIVHALGLLGWQRLRHVNRGFRRGWYLQLARITLFLLSAGLNLSIYMYEILPNDGATLISLLAFLLEIVQLIALGQGIRQTQRQAGQQEKSGAVTGLVCLKIIMLIIILLGDVSDGLIALFLILSHFICLVLLGKLISSIEEAGYALDPKPARIHPGLFLGIYVALATLICGTSFLFFSKYPMRWEEKPDVSGAEALAIAEDLRSKGFPEAVLKDLSEEDILSCRGASSVLWGEFCYSSAEVDIDMIAVAAVLSDTPRIWRVFYHFSLPDQRGYWGTETLEIRSYALKCTGGWDDLIEEPEGRILRDEKGETMAAAIPSVRRAYMQRPGNDYYFWDNSNALWSGEAYYASFSLPFSFRNARGYVSMTVQNPHPELTFSDKSLTESFLEEKHYDWGGLYYIHQYKPWAFPVQSASQFRIRGGSGKGSYEIFREAVLMPRFYPDGWHNETSP